MGDLDLKHLRALAAAASPGPWTPAYETRRWVDINVPQEDVAANHDNDAAFVAAARTAIPELLAEVERLRAALDYLRRKIDGYDTTFHFAVRDERGENPISGFEDWKADE